jgi:enoyl-CoA hydratase/carnithine racemase
MAPLFTVPIGASGSIVCTEPAPAVYLLTFTSPPDNRLTTTFIQALLDALDLVEFGGYTPGVVITTSGIPKFYSNGLDLDHAMSTEGFFTDSLYKLFGRLLTYVPFPLFLSV